MSQQAFSKARSHIDHSPFVTMFREVVSEVYSGEWGIGVWKGYQILAVDGSDIALPNMPNLLKAFGGTGRNADSPSARVSILYDVLNDMIMDAAIEPLETGERALAKAHIDEYRRLCPEKPAIIIFDRGYPSAELIKKLNDASLNFLMRVREKWDVEVDGVTGKDTLLDIKDAGKVRVIRCTLDSGEREVLITNLYDLPYKQFKALYFKRWPVETKYDIVKNKLALENFSGYTKNVILQDFWATMVLSNMCATARNEANGKIKKERKEAKTKYEYVPNVNQLIGSVKDVLIAACLVSSDEEKDKLLQEMYYEILHALVPIRPGRSVPRPSHPRKSKFHHNRKLNC
jgi:hypothetical protein